MSTLRVVRLGFASLCAALVAAAPLGIARADSLDVTPSRPAWTKMVGTLRVERYGNGSPALVLIPGLACGSWTWRETIAHESSKHAVYAVTLAGFDGVAYAPDASLDSADASLQTLITDEKLNRPIIVGHSLGGFLALRFGTEHAAELGGVVSVDGLPVIPSMAQLSSDARTAAADRFASTVTSQSADAFAAGEAKAIADYVTDPATTRKVTALALRSDQRAVAVYGKELYASDLRGSLASLTVRTELLAPVPTPPLPTYLPPQMASLTQEQRRAGTLQFYQSLTAGAPNLTVVPIDASRHFIMLDRPADFANALDAFISATPAT